MKFGPAASKLPWILVLQDLTCCGFIFTARRLRVVSQFSLEDIAREEKILAEEIGDREV